MALITGLKAFSTMMEPKPQTAKALWLKLDAGQSVRIRFLNELDEDSPNYSTDRGLAVVIAEHSKPGDFKTKCQCTMEDEGRCFGCEMNLREPKKGWYAKRRFYTNVIVDNGTDDPYVAVWSQGASKKSAFNTILEYAIEAGSVSNLTWKLKRIGEGRETQYVLIPGAPDVEPFDWDGYEPFDLTNIVRYVSYPDQEEFFMGASHDTTASSAIDW